ncbi:MAG: hypothetical protein GYA22_08070 [Bacteroidales bacterium]|nr:hypothetical protein [Bacteroidales bacterium]
MNLSGKWAGEYTFGEMFPETFRNKKVSFVLEILDADGDLSGTCSDEETLRIFGQPASVEGFAEDGMISFVKRFPYFFALAEDGSFITDKERESHEVMYHGERTENQDSYSGQWEIVAAVEEGPFGRTMELVLSGDWHMHRVE